MAISPFIKLSANRPHGDMGLVMDCGVPYTNAGGQYLYLEIPARPVVTDKGNPRRTIKAGETVIIEAACVLPCKRVHVDVVLNEVLELIGTCGYQRRREAGDQATIRVSFTPREDIDINALLADKWFVRLYAMD